MKRRWIVLLTAAMLFLAGCGSGARDTAQRSGWETQSASQVDYAGAGTEPLQELTDEEVLAAYDRAVTACAWFDLATLPSAGPMLELEGVEYQRVDSPGMETLAELHAYLRSLFSENVIARLLPENDPAPQYRDVEGALYVRPGARDADVTKGEITASVEHPDAQTYLVNVTVELLEDDLITAAGVECHAFPYCWVEDRWVFTEFQLVY